MIPYIAPSHKLTELIRTVNYRETLAYELINRLRRNGAHSIYVREKLRYALSSFLSDAGYFKKRILVSAYTCNTVAQAVKSVGAIPIYYDITKDFQPDIKSLINEANKDIAAVIISDVYGVPQNIHPWLQNLSNKPLVIADFAHHLDFDFDLGNRPWIDVILFSSNYYKPISSVGCGILCILTDKLDLEDSIMINNNYLRAVKKTVLLWLINLALHSPFLPFIYRNIFKKSGDKRLFSLKEMSKPASTVALAQAFVSRRTCNRKENYDIYQRSIPNIPIIECGENATYYSILVTPEEKEHIHREALRRGLLLGRIFGEIAGKGSLSCPASNDLANRVLNMPFLCSAYECAYATEIMRDAYSCIKEVK